MAEDTFDLLKNYFLLEPDGAAIPLPAGGEFWSQLMSWEVHPVGDELLFMLEGSATFVLDLHDGVREVALNAGRLLVIPRGVWHTAKIRGPARLLTITAGRGTQHKPA
jgi:mannose-6-phosphate isomerase-like protein (cupin superfamily)